MQMPKALQNKSVSQLSLTDCVYLTMISGRWLSFWEIQARVKKNTEKHYSENSISAAIRNLRKGPERLTYELHPYKEVVQRRKRANTKTYEYKLNPQGVDHD